MKITTEICKEKLTAVYGSSDWKRIRKYKGADGVCREFDDGNGVTYRVVSNKADTEIVMVHPVGAEATKKIELMDVGCTNDISDALSDLDKCLWDSIQDRLGADEYDNFQEFMDDNENTVFCDMDACMEFLEENDKEDDDEGNAFLQKHFADRVPAGFPYAIKTEDYVELWTPKATVSGVKIPEGTCEIDRIECRHDKDPNANFMVISEDGGAITVNAKGIVVFSYDHKVHEGDHVSTFKSKGIYIDDVLGECGTCEDEAGIKVFFKDGTVTTDEEEAFFKAFGLKPSKSADKIKEEAQDAQERKERLDARTPEQVYVDENIQNAIDKLKMLTEHQVVWLVSKYMNNYKGTLAVSPVKLFGGKEHVLGCEYLRAWLVNERNYNMIKEIESL